MARAIIQRLIEAFFEIRPLARDMGPQWGSPFGAQYREILFFDFSQFFLLVALWDVSQIGKTTLLSKKLFFY